MNWTRNRAWTLIFALSIAVMTACSLGGEGVTNPLPGGGGDNGGNAGGSGGDTVASGEIAGFGSVIVNGIEFTRKPGLADDRVKLPFSNISGAGEGQLRVGMTVKIRGTFNSVTGKGEYEAIEYQPDLRGRLDSVNAAAGTFAVMGLPVQVEADSQFDGFRDLAELTADLGAGNRPELEINGIHDGSGNLHATRIAKVATNFVGSGLVEIKGPIASAGAGSFDLGGVTVDTAGASFVNMTAADIAVGLLVDVRGTFSTATNTISAARIENKAAVEARPNDRVLVRGVAAGGIAGNEFALNGPDGAITVKSSTASFVKNGVGATAAMVAAGAKLQVEGTLDAAGAIAATKVSIEIEKGMKVRGSLGAKDSVAGTLTVNGVTVAVLPVTRYADSSSARVSPFTMADLRLNDNIEISGLVDPAGKFVAAQVQRFDLPANRTLVQGPVSEVTAGTMTILGTTVTIGAGTRFEQPDGTPFPGGEAAFLGAVVPNVTAVKARGVFIPPNGLDATAEEVQFMQLP